MSSNAFNLARRFSVKNEHDLLQENMIEPEKEASTPPGSPHTKKSCYAMIDKVCPDSPLPAECQQFDDVVVALQRRNSDRENMAIAFQGMSPGAAAAAMNAREHGFLHHAQIQRRMTNTKHKSLW